jgi:hypothetical protein
MQKPAADFQSFALRYARPLTSTEIVLSVHLVIKRIETKVGQSLRLCVRCRLQLLEHLLELLGSSQSPSSFIVSCVHLQLKPFPSPELPGFISNTDLSVSTLQHPRSFRRLSCNDAKLLNLYGLLVT